MKRNKSEIRILKWVAYPQLSRSRVDERTAQNIFVLYLTGSQRGQGHSLDLGGNEAVLVRRVACHQPELVLGSRIEDVGRDDEVKSAFVRRVLVETNQLGRPGVLGQVEVGVAFLISGFPVHAGTISTADKSWKKYMRTTIAQA